MFLFSNLNFEKLKNQSSFTLWGILILIPWNQFWQNRSFRNWKNFYGDNQFSFDDKRREFVHSNYSLLHGLTWSRVEIRWSSNIDERFQKSVTLCCCSLPAALKNVINIKFQKSWKSLEMDLLQTTILICILYALSRPRSLKAQFLVLCKGTRIK